MELYGFGLNAHSLFDPDPKKAISSPKRVLSSGNEIRILYSSWCDAVIQEVNTVGSHSPSGTGRPKYHYLGTGLTETQQKELLRLLGDVPASEVENVVFLGDAMGKGLRGIIVNRLNDIQATNGRNEAPATIENRIEQRPSDRVILFHSEGEPKHKINGGAELLAISNDPPDRAVDANGSTVIAAASLLPGRVAACVTKRRSYVKLSDHDTSISAIYVPCPGDGVELLLFESEKYFREWLRGSNRHTNVDSQPAPGTTAVPAARIPLEHSIFARPSLHATSTSFILHTSSPFNSINPLQTFTSDPRHPSLLGRPISTEHPAIKPAPVPFLEETDIVEVCAGNWIAGAVSKDGEGFVWGYSLITDSFDGLSMTSKVWHLEVMQREEDGYDDDYVRVLHIPNIQGYTARITHLGIGNGHIIVSAEADSDSWELERRVFGAGRNSDGQLGLGKGVEFSNNWTEIEEFRGKKVEQIVCRGWGTWVVVES